MSRVKTKFFEYGNKELDYLAAADPILGNAFSQLGRIEREVIPELFAALVYAIVGQLVSVRSVKTVWSRMQEKLGCITPKNLASFSDNDIQSCGITMKKAKRYSPYASVASIYFWEISSL